MKTSRPRVLSVDYGLGENGRIRLIAEIAGYPNELVQVFRDLGHDLFEGAWKIVSINFTPGDDFEVWTLQATAMLSDDIPKDDQDKLPPPMTQAELDRQYVQRVSREEL